MQIRPILRSVAAATGGLAEFRGSFRLLPAGNRFRQQASLYQLPSSLFSLSVARFQGQPFYATSDRWELCNRPRDVPRRPRAVSCKAHRNISSKCSMNNAGVAGVHLFLSMVCFAGHFAWKSPQFKYIDNGPLDGISTLFVWFGEYPSYIELYRHHGHTEMI